MRKPTRGPHHYTNAQGILFDERCDRRTLREFGLGVRASGEGRESRGSGGRPKRVCVQSHFRSGRVQETELEQLQAASAWARIQHSQGTLINVQFRH